MVFTKLGGQIMIAYYVALAAAITGAQPKSHQLFAYLERIDQPVILTPSGSGTNPVPTGNPGLWVTSNDYPSAALAEEREGLVGFLLKVGANGKVDNCQIILSSKSADLDSTACDLISQRARFSPARNPKGKPMSGSYANRVRWQIPSKGQNVSWNVPIPKPGHANLSFVVDENGKPSNCTISGSSIIDGAKTPCGTDVTFQPYYNSRGERIKVKVQTSQTVNITEENDADMKPE